MNKDSNIEKRLSLFYSVSNLVKFFVYLIIFVVPISQIPFLQGPTVPIVFIISFLFRKKLSKVIISIGLKKIIVDPLSFIDKKVDIIFIKPLKGLDFKLRLIQLKNIGPKYEYINNLENKKNINDLSRGFLAGNDVKKYPFALFWAGWSILILVFLCFGLFRLIITLEFAAALPILGVALLLEIIGIIFLYVWQNEWRDRTFKCTNLECLAVRKNHKLNSKEDIGLEYSFKKQHVDKQGNSYVHNFEVRRIKNYLTCCECNGNFTAVNKVTKSV